MSEKQIIVLDLNLLDRQRLSQELRSIGLFAALAISEPLLLHRTDIIFWGNGLVVVIGLIYLLCVLISQRFAGLKRIELNNDHLLIKNKQFSAPLRLEIEHIKSITYVAAKLKFKLTSDVEIPIRLKYYNLIQEVKKRIREYSENHSIPYIEK